MGTVDSIYRAKLNEVQSMLDGHLARVGMRSNFAKVLEEQTQSGAQASSAATGLYSSLYSGPASAVANVSAAPSDYDAMINSTAGRYGLDPNLVKAVIRVESNFNADAVSRVGAQGLMQLMPGTARGLGVTDPFDPAQNIEGGVKYISQQLKRFGDIRLALAAYNAGPGRIASLNIADADNASEYTKISEGVRGYVDKVLSYYDAYRSG